jgi:uncharacterized protein YndB with AHSA1/START domain
MVRADRCQPDEGVLVRNAYPHGMAGGSRVANGFPDGRVADTGEILELERPKRIQLKWRNEFRPELKAEGFALCTMDLEPVGAAVRLTITHSIERAESKIILAVSGGWPKVLSNLKSLLETGQIVLTEADHSHAR